jgi:hypothetical protein
MRSSLIFDVLVVAVTVSGCVSRSFSEVVVVAVDP